MAKSKKQPSINLQGPGNFRDVGKIYISGNTYVNTGVLYRSDSPSKYTESDWNVIMSLGINLIIDLRSDKENDKDSYEVPEGIRYTRNPVYNKDPIKSVMTHILLNRKSLSHMMSNAYISMIKDRAKSFGETIRLISNNIKNGTIIHCTAGKDRTGMVTAMILETLGVNRHDIIKDYSLSNKGFRSNYEAFLENDASKLEQFGVSSEEMKVLFMANPEWLENALNDITNRYGNMENYLLNQAGLKTDTIKKLRDNMIVKVSR